MIKNIDLLYRIGLNAYTIILLLITSIFLTKLCKNFSKNKNKLEFVGLGYFLTSLLLYYIPIVFSSITAHLLSLFVAFIIYVYLDKRNINTKIFLMLTFFSLRWISYSLGNLLLAPVSKFVLQKINENFNPTEIESIKISYILFVIETILELAIIAAALYFLIRIIKKKFTNKFNDLSFRELSFLSIPAIGGMMWFAIIQKYAELFEKINGKSIYLSHPYIQYLLMLGKIIIVGTIISTIILYQDNKSLEEKEREKIILENEVKDVKNHISQVEKLYKEIRGIKHDINNHISIINSLAKQNKFLQLNEYLDGMKETVDEFSFTIKTGNPITDIIVNENMTKAIEKGISFKSDFHYLDSDKLNSFDVSVILSNALKNAIEASQSGGYVNISSFKNKNIYMIVVENSFYGEILIDEDTGLPLTNKKDKTIHGFGMKNMKNIAEKYLGDISFEQKEGKVILTVMMLA